MIMTNSMKASKLAPIAMNGATISINQREGGAGWISRCSAV